MYFYLKGVFILFNGLDMDDDWVFGEVGEDDFVCDLVGGEWKGNVYYEDVDGDGVCEEQIFVDVQCGSDLLQCGVLGLFCVLIVFVEKCVDDGFVDKVELIVCVWGVFGECLMMLLSGFVMIKVKK